MENNTSPHKSNSFRKNVSPDSPQMSDHHKTDRENVDETEFDRTRISGELDRYIEALSAVSDKSPSSSDLLPQAPSSIETLMVIVESRMVPHNETEGGRELANMTEEGFSFFIESVRNMWKLSNALSEFSSNEHMIPLLDRSNVILQSAMACLEKEFGTLLHVGVPEYHDHHPQENVANKNSHKFHKLSSFSNSNKSSSRQGGHSDKRAAAAAQHDSCDSSNESWDFPGYSDEAATRLRKIALVLISQGRETECRQIYFVRRRDAIKPDMDKLEFCKVSEDVTRMPWESLESKISRWIKVVKHFTQVMLPEEQKLGESIFSEFPEVFSNLYGNLVRIVVIQLLDFVESTSMAKRSAEKLFKYLDMYETLQGVIPCITNLSCSKELINEVNSAVDRIGESVANIFCDLENAIMSDSTRTAVPGGAVHPLTRYVMNYLINACEYRQTLENIFEKHFSRSSSSASAHHHTINLEKEMNNSPRDAAISPFSSEVIRLMTIADSYLVEKSKLYGDESLRLIFLMNNGRYILQKVKGCDKIRQVMGDTWYRRRSTEVRNHHKDYQRSDAWKKILECLNPTKLLANGAAGNNKVDKALLKERFKTFTNTLDEIHRTQSTWVVSDEQLRSELRMSISGVVVPAYRSFVGRFKQYLESGGSRVDKYIKYQPEDVEALIEGLFEGNHASMPRRRA